MRPPSLKKDAHVVQSSIPTLDMPLLTRWPPVPRRMLVVAYSSFPSRRLKLIAAILYLKHAVGRYAIRNTGSIHVVQYAHKLFDLRLRLTSQSYTPEDSFVDCALLTSVFTFADFDCPIQFYSYSPQALPPTLLTSTLYSFVKLKPIQNACFLLPMRHSIVFLLKLMSFLWPPNFFIKSTVHHTDTNCIPKEPFRYHSTASTHTLKLWQHSSQWLYTCDD